MDISALIQATAVRTYDVVETAAVAVPRARERGLDLRIVGTGLRYHKSGEGSGIWVKKVKPIKTVADLKGKKLGVYSLGSAGITPVRIALADVRRPQCRGARRRPRDSSRCRRRPCRPRWHPAASTPPRSFMRKPTRRCKPASSWQSRRPPRDLTKKFGVRMVSAVFAGYGEKLDANPAAYQDFLRVVHASVDYALAHPDEVFPAVGAETKTDPAFFKLWFSQFSELPVLLFEGRRQGDRAAVEAGHRARHPEAGAPGG